MQPKQCLFILATVVFCSPLFSQSKMTADYKNIMKEQEWQVQEFAKASAALENASTNYSSTINALLEKSVIQLEGETKSESKHRLSQLNWLLHVVPIFVSVTDDKKQTKDRIDVSVNEFGETFGLSFEFRKGIIDSLMEYAEAYKKYALSYNQLLNGLQGGNIPAPSLPPPPPPSQQHHRNSSN